LIVSWIADPQNSELLPAKNLYQFTELLAPNIQKRLVEQDEGTVDERVTFDVTMEVVDHTKDKESGKLKVESIVTVWYIAHDAMADVPKMINDVLEKQNGLPTLLQDVDFMQPKSTDFVVSVTSMADETEILYSLPNDINQISSASNRGLMATVVCLLISLLFVTGVLLWHTGGLRFLQKKFNEILNSIAKSKYCCFRCCTSPSEEKDDNATSASGILGANPSYQEGDEENDVAGFTPHRGVYRSQSDFDDSQVLSPVSTNTDFSTAVPLGIEAPQPSHSLKTLHFRSPQKQKGVPSQQPAAKLHLYRRDSNMS
jgi:hypothetical protein